MKLRIQPERGNEQVGDATPEAIEAALGEVGTTVQFIIVEAEDADDRFMQCNGRELECRADLEGDGAKLYRADQGSVSVQGALPALVSFVEGTEAWRELYRWSDASIVPGAISNWVAYGILLAASAGGAVWILLVFGVL